MALANLFDVVTMIVSLSALYFAWRKAPHEEKAIDADVSDKATGAADNLADAAIKLVKPLQERINELEIERAKDRSARIALEERVSALETELRKERAEKAEVIAGAVLLVHQVQSYARTPVYYPPNMKPDKD